MSEELKDFRGKITSVTDAVLEAQMRSTGRDRAEIAREILHKWAEEQVHTATLIARFLRDEGCVRESEGLRAASGGVAGESQGARGSKRELRGKGAA